MLLHQTESYIQQKPEVSAIVVILLEIALLVAIYSIGALIAAGWFVLIWAGKTTDRIATELMNYWNLV